MVDHASQLAAIGEAARQRLEEKHRARERALHLSREIIRHSANSIRAIHRNETEEAISMMQATGKLVAETQTLLADGHADLYHTGYVQDAHKEYAEARTTYALITDSPLPSPDDLAVEVPAYLNGLGEAVGELRRYLLDSLRRDDVSRCEELMSKMDDAYNVLVTMDFPEAVTGGLRRTTDAVRGIMERTRADLTTAVRQRRLEQRLADLEGKGE
ncbi:MAG: haloacid dehalogenase [Chloroflexi bacterium]|nr:haloacid dehalogenase [Chloroflexota bacterium]